MTVCGQRTDDPGSFTPCKPCHCGDQVRAELAAAAKAPPLASVVLVQTAGAEPPTVAEVRGGFDLTRFLAAFRT